MSNTNATANTNAVSGTIKVGKPTQGHKALLSKMGYQVEEKEGLLHVGGAGFTSALDLTGDDAAIVTALKDLVRSKSLLTYGSKLTFRTPDGEIRTLSAIPMCNSLVALTRRLGLPNLSCLVVKGGPSARTPKTAATEAEAAFWEDIL